MNKLNHPLLITRPSAHMAGYIAQRLGTHVKSKLGSGSCGHAYLTADNRVIKITTDESEYITATSLVGQKHKHICEIYRTFAINYNDLRFYAIYQELLDTGNFKYLDTIRDETCRESYDWCYLYQDLFFDIIGDNKTRRVTTNERIAKVMDTHPEYKDLWEQLPNVVQDVIDNTNINYFDLFPHNIGMRGDDYVAFDLGYSKETRKIKDNEFICIPAA